MSGRMAVAVAAEMVVMKGSFIVKNQAGTQ